MLVVYTACPILPNTFDLEDGFLVGGSIVVDTLETKFMNGAGEKVKVPTVKWLKFHLKSLYYTRRPQ